MLQEAFFLCALALPSSHFTRPGIVSYQAVRSDAEKLKDFENWLKKKGGFEDVFIHESPQEETLREYGWEKIPLTWNGKQIWGLRRPKTDKKKTQESA